MEGYVSEKIAIKSGLRGDHDSGESARISMKDLVYGLGVVVDLVSAGADVVCTLRQHDAASGGNSKDLISVNPSYVKPDAESKFSKKEASNAAAITFAELNGDGGVAVIEILGEELDEGYDYVSVQFNTSGARSGASIYLCEGVRRGAAYTTEL